MRPYRNHPRAAGTVLPLTAACLALASLATGASQDASTLRAGDAASVRASATLASAIKGMGGLENLRSVRNLSILSTARQIGPQGALPISSKVTFEGAGYFREDVVSSFGHLTLIYDGENAWRLSGGEKQPMTEQDLLLLRRRVSRLLPSLLVEASEGRRQVEFVRETGDGGALVGEILVTDAGGHGVTLSVERVTGRILQLAYQTTSLEGEAVREVEERSDFRPVHGMILPFRRVILREGRRIREVTIHDYSINDELPERLFDPDKMVLEPKEQGGD